jgi:hypothetical protein
MGLCHMPAETVPIRSAICACHARDVFFAESDVAKPASVKHFHAVPIFFMFMLEADVKK